MTFWTLRAVGVFIDDGVDYISVERGWDGVCEAIANSIVSREIPADWRAHIEQLIYGKTV